MAEWSPDPRKPGRNKPPKCTEVFGYICFFPDLGVLAEVRFKKTGMNAANTLNTAAKGMGFGNFKIRLSGKMQQSSASPAPYAVPLVKIILAPQDIEGKKNYFSDLATAKRLVGLE